ncbi:HNH endonuclease [Mycolicibacterium sp. CH28]|nr:HNH endonuclease [Mycolicibacterium sp. CH28]
MSPGWGCVGDLCRWGAVASRTCVRLARCWTISTHWSRNYPRSTSTQSRRHEHRPPHHRPRTPRRPRRLDGQIHRHHYLALFDGLNGRPLWLGRTKRIATADQRIILHATDRGCTRPGCDAPGYRCEVHHVNEWATGGHTNIDQLTLACPTDHKLLDQGWTTRKLPNGTTEWIPPPQLPITGGTNTYHHPERLLGNENASPPDGADGEAA